MALRRLQDSHISSHIIGQNTPGFRLLTSKRNNIEANPSTALEPYLRAAGFWTVAHIGGYRLDNALVSALVERWRPETHSFHLPWGECTITLEDVAMILGLRVDGKAVTGHSASLVIDGQTFGMADYVEQLLGVRPSARDVSASTLTMAFLHRHFTVLPERANEESLMRFARGYIMRLIGGLLCPNKTGAEVHICFLSLLVDLHSAGKYSWGSAVLAVLYRYLCKGTAPDAAQMGGCILLLQVWAWYRMPFLRPADPDLLAPSFPLACRWTRVHTRHSSSTAMLQRFREQLDSMDIGSFAWRPYLQCEAVIPPVLRYSDPVWRTCSSLVCFDTVEWHHADRVLRQFGYHQHIPQDPTVMDAIHTVDMRGKQETKWQNYHRVWVRLWKTRHQRIAGDVQYHAGDILVASEGYYRWYWQETCDHLFLTGFRSLALPMLEYPPGVFGQTYDIPVPPTQTGRKKKRTYDNLPSESEEDVPDEWALRYAHAEDQPGMEEPEPAFSPHYDHGFQPEVSMPYQSPYHPQYPTPLSFAQPPPAYEQSPHHQSYAYQDPFGHPSASPFRTPPPPPGQNVGEDVNLDEVQFTLSPMHNLTAAFDAWPPEQSDPHGPSPFYGLCEIGRHMTVTESPIVHKRPLR